VKRNERRKVENFRRVKGLMRLVEGRKREHGSCAHLDLAGEKGETQGGGKDLDISKECEEFRVAGSVATLKSHITRILGRGQARSRILG